MCGGGRGGGGVDGLVDLGKLYTYVVNMIKVDKCLNAEKMECM